LRDFRIDFLQQHFPPPTPAIEVTSTAVNLNNESPLVVNKNRDALPFYWLDAYEDAMRTPGPEFFLNENLKKFPKIQIFFCRCCLLIRPRLFAVEQTVCQRVRTRARH